jgi:sporulation protein YqfC
LFGRKEKSKMPEKASNTMNFNKSPLMSMLSPFHIEMKSNREIIIEGCKSIEEYDENMVKIKVKKMLVCFFGRDLEIKCLTFDSLVVEGFVTSIEFMT